MSARTALAIALTALAWSMPAAAEDIFESAVPVGGQELDAQRGGTETTTDINGSIIQSNETSQSGTNNGSISIGSNAAKISGSIREATVTGNQGITAVMQNTGDLVNMNNSTSVNVYLQ